MTIETENQKVEQVDDQIAAEDVLDSKDVSVMQTEDDESKVDEDAQEESKEVDSDSDDVEKCVSESGSDDKSSKAADAAAAAVQNDDGAVDAVEDGEQDDEGPKPPPKFVKIQLEKNKWNPGDKLSGRVFAHLPNAIKVGEVRMEVTAIMGQRFVERDASGNQKETFEMHDNIFPITQCVIHQWPKDENGEPQMKSGQFEFPFSFPLHPELPGTAFYEELYKTFRVAGHSEESRVHGSSYRLDGAYLQYHVKVCVQEDGKFTSALTGEQRFDIVPPAPTDIQPRSVSQSGEVDGKTWCCATPVANATFSVNADAVRPGETFSVTCKVRCSTKKKMPLSLSLNKQLLLRGALTGRKNGEAILPNLTDYKPAAFIGAIEKINIGEVSCSNFEQKFDFTIPQSCFPDQNAIFVQTNHFLKFNFAGHTMSMPIRVYDDVKLNKGTTPSFPTPEGWAPERMMGVGFALPEPCLALIAGLYPGFPKHEPRKPTGVPATVQEDDEENATDSEPEQQQNDEKENDHPIDNSQNSIAREPSKDDVVAEDVSTEEEEEVSSQTDEAKKLSVSGNNVDNAEVGTEKI